MKKTYYHGTSIQNAEQILKDGKIIEKGTIQQLYKSENEVVQNLLKAAYLNG